MNGGVWVMISARLKAFRRFGAALGILLLLLICSVPVSALYDPHEDALVFYAARGGKRIALTFDDGPLTGKTDAILDVLARYGVRATFFMVGSQAECCTETARRVAEAGHEIGNHTSSHKTLRGLTEKQTIAEITKAEKQIYRATGYMPSLFRPPEGVCTEMLSNVAARTGYGIVLWSVDTFDWRGRSAAQIEETVLSTVKGGSVILMHDGIYARSHTAEALERLIPELRELGYEFVTVGELLSPVQTE